MSSSGFCYVADCDAYIDEAMGSIASLRRHVPNVPIAFVTHRHLFRKESPVTDWVELKQERNGPIVKTDAWLAPYDRVAFLDTDTFVIGDLSPVFAILDKFDFAFALEPNARPDYGVEAGVPEVFLEPNSGLFLFHKTPEVLTLFKTWISEYDILNRSRGVTADQPSLRTALWKCHGVRHATLGSEFNLIPHTNTSVSTTVAVIHDRSLNREWLAATVNRHIEPRAIVEGLGPVFGFATRRGWIRQYVRLTWNFLRVLIRPSLVRQRNHPVVWWRDGVD